MKQGRSPTSSGIRAMIAAAILSATGCGDQSAEKAGAVLTPRHITTELLTTRYPSPDDWHRLALFGNWDFIDESVWRTIVLDPDCDRATALAIFWRASPEYFVGFHDRTSVPAANQPHYDLINLIRERWQRGAYVRSELAFDPDTDAWPLDFEELRRRHGARVDELMPPTMRVRLDGRRIAQP